MSPLRIRNAQAGDFKQIVRLNQAEVIWTSPMDEHSLRDLDALAGFHKVAEHNGEVVGFLIAVNSDKNFENENFYWFQQRFERFIYIDRIVIDEDCKGLGIGRALYTDLFEYASQQTVSIIGCEFNLQPPNKASELFHSQMGFKQAGIRSYDNYNRSDKTVSMQVKHI